MKKTQNKWINTWVLSVLIFILVMASVPYVLADCGEPKDNEDGDGQLEAGESVYVKNVGLDNKTAVDFAKQAEDWLNSGLPSGVKGQQTVEGTEYDVTPVWNIDSKGNWYVMGWKVEGKESEQTQERPEYEIEENPVEWRCYTSDGENMDRRKWQGGWIGQPEDCGTSSSGVCGSWVCKAPEGPNSKEKQKVKNDIKRGCRNGSCYADTTTSVCQSFSCPYGCLSGNCIPKAVITIDPKLEQYQPNQEVLFSCLDSIEPECGNSTASNPSSCKFDLCSACSCSWTIKDASGAQIGSSNSKQFTFNGFTKSGTYTVELSACDDAGACGKTTMLVNVKNSPPTACFNVSPSEGIVGKTEFIFDASCSSDPEGFIIGYDWNFGDGKSDTGVKTKHVYTSSVAGTQAFEVKLVVTDNNNASAEAKKTVTVINNAPVSKFSAVPLSGLSPLTVVFVAKATDPDGHKIVAYEWDFDGDGVVDYTAGPEYIYKYSSPGTYNAKLRVQDEYGAWSLMFDLNISVYELTAIKTLTASNTAVGGSTSIYVECALPSGRNREAELQISSSDGKFSTKTTVPCDQYYLYGPLKSEGVYTITASISGCSAPECLKSTTFHVFEEMPEVVQTPEISFLLVVAVAFIALGIAKFAGNKKPQ